MPVPAIAEIAGCFAFWAWLRLGRSAWWALPGLASLAAFAGLLTLVDSPAAGRAFRGLWRGLRRRLDPVAVARRGAAARRWDLAAVWFAWPDGDHPARRRG